MRHAVFPLALLLTACSSLPPSSMRLSIQTSGGKIDVSALADERTVGSTKNAPEAVKACVQRRYETLELLGFGDYVREFRRRPVLAGVAPRLSGCAFDGFATEDSDPQLLPFTLHESTHLLGSILTGVCPDGAARCDAKAMRYEVFTPSAPVHALTIPFVGAMPMVASISKELGADSMPDSLRMYLGLPNRQAEAASVDNITAALGQGDFYLLWDEWNAYLTSLEIYTAQAAKANCWIYLTYDSYEIALSWPELVNRYLDVLERLHPRLYKALRKDGTFATALNAQLTRSENAIAKAAKYDCVRRPLPAVVEAEKLYAAAYGKLRGRAKKF